MTKHEIVQEIGKMYADLFWFRRNPQWWHDKGENLNIERHQILMTQYEYMLQEGDYTDEVNARGNIVERLFKSTERYEFDEKLTGWVQYDTDQDAHYFGVWVNKAKRKTFTYCEGDITAVTCPTEESFQAEIEDLNRFYGPPPPAWRLIDNQGNVTHVFDKKGLMGRDLPQPKEKVLQAVSSRMPI